ncbi:UrcA family protein [Phenylobacterium sp. J367]|uniref:UrcA family protein n=1 Tax=Phenylobacterium sp. J367 TaxID=2898435 RepID=UPI002150CC14|nr:UrcA family protein [Phenylobacterium sp. J367]MCR5878715.1 UrcA family protein [Phenylobacterium sp. J367]
MKSLMIAALALTMAAPAVAAERSVATADLTLSRPADAQRVLRRLDQAALEVCGASVNSVTETRRAARASDCYAQAMDAGVAAVNSPTVSDLYRERGRTYAAR